MHNRFHDLRTQLQEEGVHGPPGKLLPLPAVGTGFWLWALPFHGQDLFARVSNSQTAADLESPGSSVCGSRDDVHSASSCRPSIFRFTSFFGTRGYSDSHDKALVTSSGIKAPLLQAVVTLVRLGIPNLKSFLT